MKRIVPLALMALALAAVPVAFADSGSPAPAQQGAAHRLALLQLRVHRLEARFVRRCGTAASTAPARCVEFAKSLEQRLLVADERLQQRILTLQSTPNADKRVAFLQKLDAGVQKLSQKLHDWLNS